MAHRRLPASRVLTLALPGLLSAFLAGCASTLPRTAMSWPPAGSAIDTLDTALLDPADARRMPVHLLYPRQGSALPVVIFSHGAFSSGADYAPILSAWAARGSVVIAPTHRDSVSLGVKRGAGDARHFPWRLDDMALLLGNLDRVLDGAPGLRARTDTRRIAATGHSFGGLVAQTLGGATFFDPASGKTVSRADPRIGAVIVFSGAGAFPPILRPADFAALSRPALVTVGSNDLKQAPELTGYEWRRQPYDFAPPGDRFLLTLDGADHYLGGTVGRDDLPWDAKGPEYVAAFNAVSAAFLDAYLGQDPRAAAWMRSHASGPLDARVPGPSLPALATLSGK